MVELSSGQLIGLLLIALGILEGLALVAFGALKHKPVMIPVGFLSGVVTAAIGVALYLGKIGPG